MCLMQNIMMTKLAFDPLDIKWNHFISSLNETFAWNAVIGILGHKLSIVFWVNRFPQEIPERPKSQEWDRWDMDDVYQLKTGDSWTFEPSLK